MYSPKTIRYAVLAALLGILAVTGLLLIEHRTQAPEAATVRATAATAPTSPHRQANGNLPEHTASHPAPDDTPPPSSATNLSGSFPFADTKAPAPEAGWPRHITDARGTTTTLEHSPQRIISLAPSATQILRSIGGDAALVAIPREGSDPSEAESLVRLSVYPAPSPESVLSLRPDLLVGADITSPAVADRLRALGLPVIILSGNDYTGIVADIVRTGAATGFEATATILADALVAQRNQIEAKNGAPPAPSSTATDGLARAPTAPHASAVPLLPDALLHPPTSVASATDIAPPPINLAETSTTAARPRTLLFISQTPDYVAGSGSYASDLLKIAGAENLALKLKQPWPQLSREFILEANPHLLIFAVSQPLLSTAPGAPGRSEELTAYLQGDPLWSQLDAVRNNRVYAIDQSLLSVPGPHIGETLLQLHTIIQDAKERLAATATE